MWLPLLYRVWCVCDVFLVVDPDACVIMTSLCIVCVLAFLVTVLSQGS